MYPSLLITTPLPAPSETYCPYKLFPLDTDSVLISTTDGPHFDATELTSFVFDEDDVSLTGFGIRVIILAL